MTRNFPVIATAVATLALVVAPTFLPSQADAASQRSMSVREEAVGLERGRHDASGPVDAGDSHDHDRQDDHRGHDDDDDHGTHEHAGHGDDHQVTPDDMVAASPPLPAGDAVLLGARWDDDRVVEVRTESEGHWSPWVRLHRDTDHHAPDLSSPEAAGLDNAVSEPIWTDSVDRVQFRASRAGDLHVAYVDAASPSGVASALGGLGRAATAEARPTILRRADWGANESLRDGRVTYSSSGTVRFSVMHHEGGNPFWTSERIANGCQEAADRINAIYRYHTQVQGFWDIAYNFIVDPCGRIWEGRAGGIDRPVNGAHAAGFNDGSVGVLALGTFSGSNPDPVTQAMITATHRILGYKLGLDNVDPGGSTLETSGGGSSSRWPSGTKVTVPVLSAHQITNSTACPGWRLMETLFNGSNASATPKPGYVAGVREHWVGGPSLRSTSTVLAAWDWDGDGVPGRVIYDSSTGVMTRHATTPNGDLGPEVGRTTIGTGWNLIVAGDWNGDGTEGLAFYRRSDGRLGIYAGTASGALGTRLRLADIGPGWNNLMAGDWNQDDTDGLAFYRRSDGRLAIYAGSPTGGLGTRLRLATVSPGWDQLVAGDWNDNGADGLGFYRRSDGRLAVYAGSSTGSLGTLLQARTINPGWTILIGGDWNGNGLDGLTFYRRTDGSFTVYSGSTNGGLGTRTVLTTY